MPKRNRQPVPMAASSNQYDNPLFYGMNDFGSNPILSGHQYHNQGADLGYGNSFHHHQLQQRMQFPMGLIGNNNNMGTGPIPNTSSGVMQFQPDAFAPYPGPSFEGSKPKKSKAKMSNGASAMGQTAVHPGSLYLQSQYRYPANTGAPAAPTGGTALAAPIPLPTPVATSIPPAAPQEETRAQGPAKPKKMAAKKKAAATSKAPSVKEKKKSDKTEDVVISDADALAYIQSQIAESGSISVSAIRKGLQIGYKRASRLLDTATSHGGDPTQARQAAEPQVTGTDEELVRYLVAQSVQGNTISANSFRRLARVGYKRATRLVREAATQVAAKPIAKKAVKETKRKAAPSTPPQSMGKREI